MKKLAAAAILTAFAVSPAVAAECDELRGEVENFWRVPKGETSKGFNLVPMALSTRNPTTTMPQLGLVCRKDQAGGNVTIIGDETPFNATLASDECRLIYLLGVKQITAAAGADLSGEEACGSFQVIR